MAVVTLVVGTQFVAADHATDFTTATDPLTTDSYTDVQLDLTSLADDAARESAQFDLGANRAARYALKPQVEWGSAPTTGETLDFYVGFSTNSTASAGQPGNLTGSDAAYTGSPATLDEGLSQLKYIGSMHVTADAVVQTGPAMFFEAEERYAVLVVVNRSGQALQSDANEHHVLISEVDEDIT